MGHDHDDCNTFPPWFTWVSLGVAALHILVWFVWGRPLDG